MSRLILIMIVSVLIPMGAAAGEEPPMLYNSQNGPHQIACDQDLILKDSQRGKELALRLTWPEAGGPFPLIVWSHGLGASKDLYQPLVEYWASHGYVIIQPTHSDSLALKDSSRHVLRIDDWQSRPEDVKLILDSLKTIEKLLPALKGKIDRGRMGAGGHSFGAVTTQHLAGVTASVKLFSKERRSFADPRLKAFVAVSPITLGKEADREAWKDVHVPMLMITGSNDLGRKDNPGRKEPLEFCPPEDKYLLFIKDAHHGFGGIVGPVVYLSSGPLNTAHVDYVKASSLAMWDAYLKKDREARAFLNGEDMSAASKGEAVISTRSAEAAGPFPAGTSRHTLIHAGLERSFMLYVPPALDRKAETSLVLVLHGGGGNADKMAKLTGGTFEKLANRDGFIVAYPQGIEKHWNDGRSGGLDRAHKENIDDSGFIGTLIDHLSGRLPVDAARVYATGISNGGFMSFHLALTIGDRLAAIAPVTANLVVDHRETIPPCPVPVMIINGTADPLVPYEGGNVGFKRKPRGQVISTRDTVAFWVGHNHSEAIPRIIAGPDRDPDDGMRVARTEYKAVEEKSAPVILITIEGGGHTWPGGWQYLGKRLVGPTCREFDAAEVIWDFFKQHKR